MCTDVELVLLQKPAHQISLKNFDGWIFYVENKVLYYIQQFEILKAETDL